MNSFILATGNSHKAEEFAKLFPSDLVLIEAAPAKLEVLEDGESFQANALIKAKAYYDKYKKPVLSDDSGLCVDSLPAELGIHSARFGGEGLDDRGRANLLLSRMEGVSSRSAYFICVLCFYLSDDEIFFFEGRVNGRIADEYKGEHGFGYDPVFLPEGDHAGKSLAELPEWKNINSHRAKAVVEACKFFHGRIK